MSRESWEAGERAWGDHEPEPIDVELGPWRFELRGDELADLSYDGSAVVRSVRCVARDRDWNTVPAVVESFAVQPDGDGDGDGDGADLELAMRGFGADLHARLEVRADGSRLAVRLTATSRTEFATNRLGLIVLHPPTLAGTELEVGTPGGEVRRTSFPVAISPHQPAMDIETIAWMTPDGISATAAFEGDVFEMEDQRNWTDASYKTYSTPLSRPFPVLLAPGAVVEQAVVFEAERLAPRMMGVADAPTDAAKDAPTIVELVATDRVAPAVTLGASTVPDDGWSQHPLPDGVAALLVELDTGTTSWRAALDRARREAGELPLDVRITAADPAAVRDVVEAVSAARPIARLGVFAAGGHVTEPALFEAIADAASRALPDAELVGGARSHFTELNRRHAELPDALEGVAFALTPQMHATERAQLVESIPMQAAVVRDALRIAAGRPLHVGPITLRSRFNTVATSSPVPAEAADAADAAGDAAPLAAGYGAALVPTATDPRQTSHALAVWTVASYAAICGAVAVAPVIAAGAGGVATVDYFEASGPRGIRDATGPFPVAAAIAAIAELGGARLLVPSAALPPGVQLVGGVRPDGTWRVLVANLGERPATLVLRHDGHVRRLAAAPFEVVVVDSHDD